MNKRLSCYQVSALLNFYLEDKLNSTLKDYVEQHLENCPKCQEKIGQLKAVIKEVFHVSRKDESKDKSSDYKTLNSLSAYMDNELNNNENIRIKKMTISNSKVRKELETLYKFQKAIHSAYEKTKNDSKFDYSKDVMAKIQNGYEYTTGYFYKLAALFVVLMLGIIAGFTYLNF